MPNATRNNLVERINSREFEGEFHRWVAFAQKLVQRAGLTPAEAEAGAILGDTVVDCLADPLQWKEGVDFVTFFSNALRDRVRREARRIWRRRRVTPSTKDAPEVAADSKRRAQVMDAMCLLGKAREALSGDPRTKAMLEAIEDGADQTADVKKKLGWSAEHTRAVRVAANRRLEAAGLSRGKKDTG